MRRRFFIKMAGLITAGSVISKRDFTMEKQARNVQIAIRIHHFFDIIRDLRSGNKILPDINYRHSYHSVANILRDSPGTRMKIVMGVDAVCDGCVHNVNGKCDDPLTIKRGFTMKHDYNNWLDQRILAVYGLKEGMVVTPGKICVSAKEYLDNIYKIYELDPGGDIDTRKKEFIEGLKFYSANNGIKLKYLSQYGI
jgi:hypothetical protein